MSILRPENGCFPRICKLFRAFTHWFKFQYRMFITYSYIEVNLLFYYYLCCLMCWCLKCILSITRHDERITTTEYRVNESLISNVEYATGNRYRLNTYLANPNESTDGIAGGTPTSNPKIVGSNHSQIINICSTTQIGRRKECKGSKKLQTTTQTNSNIHIYTINTSSN